MPKRYNTPHRTRTIKTREGVLYLPRIRDLYQAEGADSFIGATCIKASGVKEVCTHCGDEKTTYWLDENNLYEAPTGHDWEEHETVVATCEVAGVPEYWKCKNCGLYFVGKLDEDAEAPANDLAEDELSETAPEAGETAEHTFDSGDEGSKKDLIEATCQKGESYKLYKRCTECDKDILVQTVVGDESGADKDAHKKVLDGNPLKAATYTTAGIAKHISASCAVRTLRCGFLRRLQHLNMKRVNVSYHDCFSHDSNSPSVSFPASHSSRFSLALSLHS